MTMVAPPPPMESAGDRDMAIKEARLEQLLSEKLMQGYVLMETSCPKCSTPLVKNHQMVPRTLMCPSTDENKVDKCVLLPQESFDQPFRPVDGVPMCVSCNSHVITQETEVSILEQCDSMRDKGSIYVALEDATNTPHEPIVIHLEDNDFEDSDYRNDDKHLMPIPVDIDTTSLDGDGNTNFEVILSPREGDAAKPINLEAGDEVKPIDLVEEDLMESYTARREIATKVLGAKMLQGYTLQEKTCDKCAMPVMSYKGRVNCVVCPALAKKAKKKLRQQQKLEEEKARLERKIEEKKTSEQPKSIGEIESKSDLDEHAFEEDLRHQREKLDHIKTVRSEIEERVHREEQEDAERAEERQKTIAAQKSRILNMEMQGEEVVLDSEKKEDPFVLIEQERGELARLETIAKEEQEKHRFAKQQREKKEHVAALEAQKKAVQEVETKALAEELERIEGFDEETLLNDKALAMKKDLMVDEYRKRMAEKAALDEEIAGLEEERLNENMEARRVADEYRAESESRMIAALEADAALKALAAEDAIRRAKEALAEIVTTKKQIISQTIEMAEKEVIAEAEQTIKADREDYMEPIILPTDSEIAEERWETLRMEGRAIMTRRIIQGWQLLPEACKGAECFMSPLIGRLGRKECCVCGGTGSGTDGAYHKSEELEEAAAAPALTLVPASPSVKRPVVTECCDDGSKGEDWLTNGHHEEFEKQRAVYSKEIGKRMLQGWILVDASCPKCIMPLMMDDLGNTDICVVCGEVKHFDASTIATRDMAAFEVVDEVADIAKDVVEEVAVAEARKKVDDPKKPVTSELVEASSEDPYERVVRRVDSDLCSTIQKQAKKQQRKRKPVTTSDPPAFKPDVRMVLESANEIAPQSAKDVIPLETNDFADSAAIQKMVGDQGRDDTQSVDTSIETVANMFLKSPHGYDFQDFGKSMNVDEVQELVDIFLVTNVDREVSDDFKFSVAQRILAKMNFMTNKGRDEALPLRIEVGDTREQQFNFNEVEEYSENMATKSTGKSGKRTKPKPEDQAPRRLPPMSPSPRTTPRSGTGRKNTVIVGGPMAGGFRRSRGDDMSVVSRASTVASDALESIYDRIDACKTKLLDSNNSLDEQIATASLLERLAQAAVAVKEMEYLE